jgi:hypothetical protein
MAAAFLANFLFWSGLAIGGIVLAALVDVCGGAWLDPMRHTAERFRRFHPIYFACFLVLMWRSADVYPWARQPVHRGWFAPPIVALRGALTLAAVYGLAFRYCRASRMAREAHDRTRQIGRVAVVFLIVYAFGFSIIATDLIMSLEPRWTSTLFPAYVFTGNVYTGAAAVALCASWRSDAAEALVPSQVSDLATLLAGLALFWAYLFWSQFLVIWYGNLPSELGFMTARIGTARSLGWVILGSCCAVPSIVFVPKSGRRIATLRTVSLVVLTGLWLERWLFVAPDLAPSSGVWTFSVSALFAALFTVAIVQLRPSRPAQRFT